MKKIAVIGCGAAGMMAALAAAKSGCGVTIFEKNEKPGKKIYITGKGRCNVTNACDTTEFFNYVKRNPKFLYSAVYGFDNTMVMDFFESNKCHLKVERGDRVFPVSDHSSDIIRTLYDALLREGVKVEFDSNVHSLEAANGQIKALTYSQGDGGLVREEFDSIIVCTGGASYPSTGSTGDGYKFAKALGHNIKKPVPSLVPFEIKENWYKDLQGLALKNVGLKMFVSGSKSKRPVYDGFGEMLFTHFGISGPLVLTASCQYEEGKETRLVLDLKPALTVEQLDKRVLRDFESGLNKQFKNVLGGLFPSKLIPVMIKLSGIDPDTPVNAITKEQRLAFVNLIKAVPMTVTGTRGFNEAIITRGGVDVKEVNPSTMESKLVKGLFFAGEVLDVDAETGGFNLQIAWSTGWLAGEQST